MFKQIVQNAGGMYEVRIWTPIGFQWLGDSYDNPRYWWSGPFRKRSYKFVTLAAARQALHAPPKPPKPRDRIVWPWMTTPPQDDAS